MSKNWNWDRDSQSVWKPAKENWQAFNRQWYGNVDARLDDPSVSLDARDIGADKQTIIVLSSYLTMFDHLWAKAFMWNNGEGFIITGQPGIGVS